MLTDAQVRAGRALLGISQADLAAVSGVSLRTIKRIELGETVRGANSESIRHALEKRGVEFIEENGGGPGVRLKKRRR